MLVKMIDACSANNAGLCGSYRTRRADLEWRRTGARPSFCLRMGPSSVTALIPIREL